MLDISLRTKVQECVERGAALLDIEQPGWAKEISIWRLDMGSSSGCVLAQLNNGSYSAGCRWLFAENDPVRSDVGYDWCIDPDAIAHGFTSNDFHAWDYLQELWRSEIRVRQHDDHED